MINFDDVPASKKSFVINSAHADMIVNDLLQGDYEALGRLFTDLVNFNIYGDYSIIENIDDLDRTERTARKLLQADSENYIEHFVAKSQQNAKNRTSGHQPTRDELIDYARAKGYDEQTVIGWGMEQAQREWKDNNGDPIRYWKKTLDAYMQAINKKKIADITKGFSR